MCFTRTKFEAEILQICKGYSLIKHIAAVAQYNPFSEYSYNCFELAYKYGANFDKCTYRIVNKWNNSTEWNGNEQCEHFKRNDWY